MPLPLRVAMAGGDAGPWKIEWIKTLCGEELPKVSRLSVLEGEDAFQRAKGVWVLKGVTSNQRYATEKESAELKAKQEGLGRPQATRASLIPITKSQAWWDLSQDERRSIFEEQSKHVSETLKYLPAIARRLHHCRDLGGPFDFLTWFEFAPEQEALFDELTSYLRASEEWKYVEREVEIRLFRQP